NSMKRAGAGVPLVHSTPMPYDNYFGGVTEDFHWFEKVLDDEGGGLNKPAAVIVETVQGEGGVNVARAEWLQALNDLCAKREIILIVDDVQMGCGRTGAFFSFEDAGIRPDIVTLSKSISGYGLPMALTLIRPDLDQWAPGEHNGTFRGNNPAFVTATATLQKYWQDAAFSEDVRRKGDRLHTELSALGIAFADTERGSRVSKAAFERGLLVETSGPKDEVVKLLPALTTTDEQLDIGIATLREAIAESAR
ncbi:Diaminobutyrate--2-oxoglutarate transaminase, partial [Aduncisulcus paluster]